MTEVCSEDKDASILGSVIHAGIEALSATGDEDMGKPKAEPINGVNKGLLEAEEKMELGNGIVDGPTEVHEAPARIGPQEDGEVAVLSGEGLQANHAPTSEQQEAQVKPPAGMILEG